jgi:hypothetical protein
VFQTLKTTASLNDQHSLRQAPQAATVPLSGLFAFSRTGRLAACGLLNLLLLVFGLRVTFFCFAGFCSQICRTSEMRHFWGRDVAIDLTQDFLSLAHPQKWIER